MSADEVIIRAESGVGWISLNRPEALHALTTDICREMTEALLAWRHDDDVRVVVIDHAEGRGFCAGGDVRALYESVQGDGRAADAFFDAEYRLNALIKSYPKLYVAFMDGVTMGGGVGVSVHGAYRIVTERTLFAMPETGIGLFPDVGGGWFLPRLPGRIGVWLALTGARLRGPDCLHAGIATHYAPAERLGAMKARIAEAARLSLRDGGDAAPALRAGLLALSEEPDAAPIETIRDRIDALFAGHGVEAICHALAAEGSDWAKAQLAAVESKSPLSLKVALRQLGAGAALTRFHDVMRMEQAIARRLVRAHDFREGVRAQIIDKDNAPRWAPATLAEVGEEMVEAVFAPLDAGEALRFVD